MGVGPLDEAGGGVLEGGWLNDDREEGCDWRAGERR